ncbi:MAG: type II secretion system protein [Candidatus Saccharibacteria bacterium]|nr:type II secretion system protein [Candidatus Saccharibacteria bacterium]
MKKGDFDSKRGFTVIEVALVLAIAGLIFLMVFVALPGLRTSQRDAERREDVTMLLESVKEYQTNNRGALPGSSEKDKLERGETVNVTNSSSGKDTTWAGFYKKYLGQKFADPSGEYYKLKVIRCGSQAADQACKDNAQYAKSSVVFPNNYTMLIVLQASCYGDKTIGTSNPRKLAVVYKLEGAGVYCSNI